jgi:hypothetical protein
MLAAPVPGQGNGPVVMVGEQPAEVIVRPSAPGVEAGAPLRPEEQKRVNEAIGRGVAYLRRSQHDNGSFGDGIAVKSSWSVGHAALSGLTLLECGTPPADPAVLKAARFVRFSTARLNRTYEISLALLFLDRLGDPQDHRVIRSLALRLAVAQNARGGWSYTCPILGIAQETKLMQYLQQQKLRKDPKKGTAKKPSAEGGGAIYPYDGDNSNTQFALLALWAAQRHELPLEYTLARVEERFRSSQLPSGGWGYSLRRSVVDRPYGSMICVGLLALAVGRVSAAGGSEPGPALGPAKVEDEGINRGLRALGIYLVAPADADLPRSASSWGEKGTVNLYFLWSVERVGVLCDLKTIGGKDWYRWGLQHLLPAQKPNGSWVGRGSGGSPVADTCMALLFLKRADLLPGLRERLQMRLAITDPGPASPGERQQRSKSPGESPGARP